MPIFQVASGGNRRRPDEVYLMPKFPSVRSTPIDVKFKQIMAAAELCISANLNTAALILLYSAIDAASWLCAEDPDGQVQDHFVPWVEKYLLSTGRFECTALDLWGARCGIVHTLSPSSRLSRKERVREILYVNRGGNRGILDRLEAIRNAKSRRELRDVRVPDSTDVMRTNVVLETDALMNAFQGGFVSMLSDAKQDAALNSRIRGRASKVLSTMSERRAAADLAWCETMLALADAAERQVVDLPYSTDCSGCGSLTARVLVRAIDNGGASVAHSEMCDECADALGGNAAIRDLRKR